MNSADRFGGFFRGEIDVRPLKTLTQRIQRRVRGSNPLVYLVVTEDGRKYKVLEGRPTDRVLTAIRGYRPYIEGLEFVPRIVGGDDRHIIVEYVGGEAPDPASEEFARALGRNLARVNAIDQGRMATDQFMAERLQDLDAIVTARLLERDGARKLADSLRELEPESVTTCLDYRDMQRANFIRAPSGELFFIDLGAFERGKPPGLYLFSRSLFDGMRQDVFKQSYIAAGGPEFLFDNERYLRIAALLERAGRYSAAAARAGFFGRRARRHRLGLARAAAEKLRGEIASPTEHVRAGDR